MAELACEPLWIYISGVERKINFSRLLWFEGFSEFFMLNELNTIGYVVLLMTLENNILSFKS